MIGYYVHHVGHGHLHRATAVAQALAAPVTGFSSLAAPAAWPGEWVQLDADDSGDAADSATEADRTARDRLHWAPLGDPGLRRRMGRIASWLAEAAPTAFVVDVSAEVAALVRLHGIPVVTVVGPGERGDPAHRLGFDLADALVGCWPPEAAGMLRGVPPSVLERLHLVGAVSRYAVDDTPHPRSQAGAQPRRVVLLSGTGGHDLDTDGLQLARSQTPGWEWTVLDRELGSWVDDPFPLLCAADVVVTHAGQNALAEVAAARTPAVVVPQERPHHEQVTTAEVLRHGGWPALVEETWPHHGWAERLDRAANLPGADWSSWCDGHAAERIAAVVRATALS